MNFPDLETCRAISDEFPESEFVWIPGCREPIRRNETCKFPLPDELELISAPTCEELGEWLRSEGDGAEVVSYGDYNGDLTWVLSTHMRSTAHDKIIELSGLLGLNADETNETQARAEAVALLKKTKK